MVETNWPLEFLRLVPASIIGFCVAYVAYMQWRTAHAKLLLDIFERRFEIYAGVLEANTLAHTDDDDFQDAYIELFDLRSRAAFLFGDEVIGVITSLITCIGRQRSNRRRLSENDLTPEDRDRFSTQLLSDQQDQVKLGRDFQEVCLPYLKITSKQVRTPAEWFKAKNEARWRYADDKQRRRT